MLRGRCLCGAVTIEISGPVSAPTLCHCGMCRRLHGAQGAYTSAPVAAYRITGEDNLNWYPCSSKSEQGFCRVCGSKLFWRAVGSSALDVTLGCLDTPTGLTLGAHIWVRSRGDYYEVGTDGVPQFAESSRGAQPIPPEHGMPDNPQPGIHTGGCQCKAVTYRVAGRMRDVVVCHCGQCRSVHGHAPGYSAARRTELTISGEDRLVWYASSDQARRGFCRDCGSSLFWARNGHDNISITAGSVAAPTGLKTVRHIFVEDKSDYYRIADGVPEFTATMAADPVTF